MNDDKIKPLTYKKLKQSGKFELSGCPYCGAEAYLTRSDEGCFGARCSELMDCGAEIKHWDTMEHAIKAWNRRPIAQEVREEGPARVHRYAEYFERMTKAESQLSALTKERDELREAGKHLFEIDHYRHCLCVKCEWSKSVLFAQSMERNKEGKHEV